MDYSFELGNIEKGLEQRLVRYRPIMYVHVYILDYILKLFGGRVLGWAFNSNAWTQGLLLCLGYAAAHF